MNEKNAKNITVKISAIALEELNGYSKKDAIRLTPENEGHEFFERTKKLLMREVKEQKTPSCKHGFKYSEGDNYYRCTHCGTYSIDGKKEASQTKIWDFIKKRK